MSEAPTHIYAYRDGYYPYWTTDPDLHRDAAQYVRADIAVGAAVAVKDHVVEREQDLRDTTRQIEYERSQHAAQLAECHARIATLEEALQECADDLESEVKNRYSHGSSGVHPALLTRYNRDMEPVKKARQLLGGQPE